MSNPIILAIETSCDETGVAVVHQKKQAIETLASEISSQIDIHALTGGVVPEVAAREHATVIQPMLGKVLSDSKTRIASSQAPRNDSHLNLDAIAVTVGPGLVPALSVGVTTAQALAYAWQKPIIPVHHLEGHIYSALLSKPTNLFPALALVVSGGHTMLVLMSGHLQYQVLGSTRDDAAGEAFDKVARLLGLSYPGGPAISKTAEEGDPNAFSFTRPMLHSGDLDFSFSGLKTEVLYTVRKLNNKSLPPKQVNDLAASFQQTVVDTLIAKTDCAIKQTNPQLLLLSGGVAANQLLRQRWEKLAKQHNLPAQIPPIEHCQDNAIMIGQIGLFAYQAGRTKQWSDIDASGRINLEAYSTDQSDLVP